jgi:phage tail sheath protein FI
MAELLSPGVFIEEVSSQVQVVQPVSTSNMGIIGATQRGPTDVATLVTSFPQFERIFGPQIADSRTSLAMGAFYANGGRRAFVVRVMPSDASEAAGFVTSARRDFQTNVGDGATAAITEAVLSGAALPVPVHAVPTVAGVTWSWRSDGTPLVADPLVERDGTTALVQASIATVEGRIDPTSLPTVDLAHPSVIPGATITLNWDPDGATPTTLALAQVGTTLVASGTSGAGTVATLDLVTGFLSVEFAGVEVPVVGGDGVAITLDFTPGTALRSVSDDGSGVIVDDGSGTLTGPGTVTYTSGAFSFTTSAGFEPGTGALVLSDLAVQTWDLDPISVGTWANDMRVDISGNADYFDAATNTYSRFNMNVLLLNPATSLFDILETYEELDFVDSTSAQYFAAVVNDLSDLLQVVEPALTAPSEAPAELNGAARAQVVAGGDEDAANRQVDATLLDTPIQPRTVSITWTDSTATARTVTDDGSGNLIGDVDGAGTNTIDYTTGVINLLLSDDVNATTFVTAAYRSTAEDTSAQQTFSGGADGTFTSGATYGRNQFTAPGTLQTNYQGLYALDRIEELMQVVIPDFAGDIQITQDLFDYVDSRESLPSGGDRFAILTVPQGSTAQEAVDFLRFDVLRNSKFAAMYWPWVRVADPLQDNRPVTFPALAHLAGIYARTDTQRNVGKAPGGVVDGALRFLTGLESKPTQGERDFVYPARINPLISSPQTGLAVWGVRTTSLQSEWRYINARRLFMFVEKSVFNSTAWIVFENNGPALWARIKAQIQSFLNGLFNDGLFAGSTPTEAFFVIVDETNNTADSINQGQVIIDIGIAPNRPAEFVRFRFQQKTLSS